MRKKDLTGLKFGLLTVIYETFNYRKGTWWYCKCECGTTKEVSTDHLTRKTSPVKSCGCLHRRKGHNHPSYREEIELTQENIKELLDYDSETGKLYWKVSRGSRVSGDEAGYLDCNGYVKIKIGGHCTTAHRIAFLYKKGYIPEQVDHIDRNPSNNSWRNLRESTQQENTRNRSLSSVNKYGFKGISYQEDRKKWSAGITLDGITKYLGRYNTREQAARAYNKAAVKYFGEFATLNNVRAGYGLIDSGI